MWLLPSHILYIIVVNYCSVLIKDQYHALYYITGLVVIPWGFYLICGIEEFNR